MDLHPEAGPVIAYETQARYGPGEEWVTLTVSAQRLLALDEAFVRHDPWGREPTEIRVRSIRCHPRRHR
jgi:hypothetical protein